MKRLDELRTMEAGVFEPLGLWSGGVVSNPIHLPPTDIIQDSKPDGEGHAEGELIAGQGVKEVTATSSALMVVREASWSRSYADAPC